MWNEFTECVALMCASTCACAHTFGVVSTGWHLLFFFLYSSCTSATADTVYCRVQLICSHSTAIV